MGIVPIGGRIPTGGVIGVPTGAFRVLLWGIMVDGMGVGIGVADRGFPTLCRLTLVWEKAQGKDSSSLFFPSFTFFL